MKQNLSTLLFVVLFTEFATGCVDDFDLQLPDDILSELGDSDTEPVLPSECSGECLPLTWIAIPGGTYEMGRNMGDEDEAPAHTVTIAPFQMNQTEVTVTQYRQCVDAGECTTPHLLDIYANWDEAWRGNHPVNGIDWNQAGQFCAFVGGRLPSEAEWEYAARSGGKNIEFPWGNDSPSCDYANMNDAIGVGCDQESTSEVCSRPLGNTEHALCDMAGNVWEMLQDTYHENYLDAPETGIPWVDNSVTQRVARGGSFFDDKAYMVNRVRGYIEEQSWYPIVGVRCAKDMPRENSWIDIEAGEFQMGNDSVASESPVHPVQIASFSIQETEVTVSQYKKCVDAEICSEPKSGGDYDNWGNAARDDHPINGVSLAQAKQYCQWINGRLPTEAEWEYVATSQGEYTLNPFGEIPADCDYAMVAEGTEIIDYGCETRSTAEVCAKSTGNSTQGVCDLIGNLWEWVEDDWHENYTGAPANGSAWSDADAAYHVVRGGSFASEASTLRASYRIYTYAEDQLDILGFRCAQ
ncbi:MAG: formylglycine-generating enzyme family protein [Deltaproteobacteria bacterium]|nr:formylglycine-generating enzyme family protein [Deltaproteobacteria bacterium]MBN2673888.1 formylglycine-generating enzyme family protein [Deltaproteobacteria bacterium]